MLSLLFSTYILLHVSYCFLTCPAPPLQDESCTAAPRGPFNPRERWQATSANPRQPQHDLSLGFNFQHVTLQQLYVGTGSDCLKWLWRRSPPADQKMEQL